MCLVVLVPVPVYRRSWSHVISMTSVTLLRPVTVSLSPSIVSISRSITKLQLQVEVPYYGYMKASKLQATVSSYDVLQHGLSLALAIIYTSLYMLQCQCNPVVSICKVQIFWRLSGLTLTLVYTIHIIVHL